LIQGDCLEVMRTLPDASVDAVITDPPFGIGLRYGDSREAHSTPEGYRRWLAPIYAEMLRVLKPGGFFAAWQAQLYMRHFWEWFGPDIRIYAACKNFVQIRPTPINYGYDPVVMFYKAGGEPRRPRLCEGGSYRTLDFFVADTASVISDLTRVEKTHPCPRPLDQTIEIVRNFTLPGGTVLDPFMGSGTTGVACVREGRDFIGVEIDPAYFAIAQSRIDEAEACRDGRGVGELFTWADETFPSNAPQETNNESSG
jgi:hypothetical protein